MEYLVNQTIKLPFTAPNLQTGLTSFTGSFLVNGNVVVITPTFSEVGGGLYTASFTPATTGKWCVFLGGQTQSFEVVSKTLQNGLQDVIDECLGSWAWNKSTGVLTLFRGDGTTLATYDVVDNADSASRERVS